MALVLPREVVEVRLDGKPAVRHQPRERDRGGDRHDRVVPAVREQHRRRIRREVRGGERRGIDRAAREEVGVAVRMQLHVRRGVGDAGDRDDSEDVLTREPEPRHQREVSARRSAEHEHRLPGRGRELRHTIARDEPAGGGEAVVSDLRPRRGGREAVVDVVDRVAGPAEELRLVR